MGLLGSNVDLEFMRDAHVVQQSRAEVRQPLNLPPGAEVITKRADGIRDDTADSCADGVADGCDGLGLHLSGATHADVVVERVRTIDLGDVPRCSDDGEGMGIVVVGCNPILDHLMGIG